MNTLKDRLTVYFTNFRTALAPTLPATKAHIAFIGLVWRYLLHLSGRLDRLVTRWRNGTLPIPRAHRPGQPRAARTAPRAAPAFPLPRGVRWLIRRLPGTGIGAFGSQLEHLLANDAELREFLKAAPQARRLLAPVCRMFGITPPEPPAPPALARENPRATQAPRPAANPAPSPEPAANPPPPHPHPIFSTA